MSAMNPRAHVSRSRMLCLALMAACAASVRGLARTLPTQPGQTLDPLSTQWPLSFAANCYQFAVYHPQIARWPGNQIPGSFATAVHPAGSSNKTSTGMYGAGQNATVGNAYVIGVMMNLLMVVGILIHAGVTF